MIGNSAKEKKVKKALDYFTEILEWIINIVVLISILVATISLWEPFCAFLENRADEGAFMEFMGYVFNVIIGIEFKKMLGKPDANTVMEILVFVIVRHMIIVDTSSLENLLTIIGVILIFLVKKYLNDEKQKNKIEIEKEKIANVDE